MDIRPKDRVGAVLVPTPTHVKVLGYGTVIETMEITVEGRATGAKRPRIQLDNGAVIEGGPLIWWAEEAEMRRRIYRWEAEGRTIETVATEETVTV